MSTLCLRCALRLRGAAASRNPTPAKRTLSSSAAKRKGALPQFQPSTQPELDDVLASLRDKWLLPAALSNQERNLIYKPRYKKQLSENPELVTIGEEDVELHHIDRFADVPSLKKELLPRIVELMAKGEKSDWNNLPELLAGLKRAKLTPKYDVMGKIARKAVEAGRFGIILRCLQQAELTQMTLRKPDVLYNVIYALREMAQREQWSEAATSKAIRDANEVAMLLEDEAHGGGRRIQPNDARARPDVLAVYLELTAVYAFKHQGGRDVDGKVKAYAERLLSNMQLLAEESGEDRARIRPSTNIPVTVGPQTEILRGVPIYHGLRLAMRILGEDMPNAKLAKQIVRNWDDGLTSLTDALRTQAKEKAHGFNRWPKSGTYGWQALKAWRSCLELDP